jgi:hypothetical protein
VDGEREETRLPWSETGAHSLAGSVWIGLIWVWAEGGFVAASTLFFPKHIIDDYG